TTRSIVSLSYFAGITLILLDGIRASTEPRTVHFTPEEDLPDDLWATWTNPGTEFRLTDEPVDDPHEPAPF
ncbi:hypothetical protein HDC37_001832, partial [Microbacterium sp. AK009]|uniref:hypothetical protein n=1 Tax=Microbacterium sp. AK009 TaxID=2723068 RepID=UPI001854E0AB